MTSDWEKSFIDIVERRFQEIRVKNKRFSLRSYARMAQISPGAMSSILNRTMSWSISPDRALTVLHNIKAENDKINHFKVLCTPKCTNTSLRLSEESEHLFLTDPVYMPICLAFSLTSPPSPADMAACLGISKKKVLDVIEDLLQRGYLVRKEGRITRASAQRHTTGDGPPNSVIRKYHKNNFEALHALIETGSLEDRDVSSLVLTGNSQQIAAVKQEIQDFYQRIHAIMNATDSTNDIFRICVGFMPLKMRSSPSKDH